MGRWSRRVSFFLVGIAATVGLTGCYSATQPASNITDTHARLNARGNTQRGYDNQTPDTSNAYFYFEYATSQSALGTSSSMKTPTVQVPGTAPDSDLHEDIVGLQPQTTYYFRVCGADVGQSAVCAATNSFATLAPQPMHSLFPGRNIYSPTLMVVNGAYVMWYGGWQTEADVPNDKIYARISANNTDWSGPVTEITPGQIPGGGYTGVNDPTVTYDAGRSLPYTMFFTACRTCGFNDGEIWSAESSDGANWTNFKLLLGGSAHPTEPSAVIEQSGQQEWKVYYENRTSCNTIRMATVNANRDATTVDNAVYSTTEAFACLLSAEVKFFNGSWHLFYNRSRIGTPPQSNFTIEVAKSQSNTSWTPDTYTTLITNNGPTYCSTVAPGVLPAGGAAYDLYFGLTPYQSDGSCDVSHQQSIERWRLQD